MQANSARKDSLPEPLRELGLGERTGGKRLHRAHRFGGIEAQSQSVVGQKKTGSDPGRTLVAIRKTMIAGKSESVGGSQRGSVRRVVSRQILLAG